MRRPGTLHRAAENDISSADRQHHMLFSETKRLFRQCVVMAVKMDVGTSNSELGFIFIGRGKKRVSIAAGKACQVEHPGTQLSSEGPKGLRDSIDIGT